MADDTIPSNDEDAKRVAKRLRNRVNQARSRANRSPEKVAYYKQKESEYAAQNRDKLNARMRRWRSINKDHYRQWCSANYRKPENLQKSRERDRKRKAEQRAINLAIHPRPPPRSPDELREMRRRHRATWLQKLSATKLAYQKDRYRAKAKAREAILRSRPGQRHHTPADIQEIYKAQRGRCAACHISIRKGYHVDHIQPLAKGGSNEKRNIQLLCAPCNQDKRAQDPIVFMQKLGRLL